MLINTFNVKLSIDYNVLSKYHFAPQVICESYIEKGKNPIEEFEFELNVNAETPEQARINLIAYGNLISDFGIADHFPHIVYLTQKILEFEGNAKSELKDYKYILGELELLSSLLSLKNDKKTKLTLEHKNFGKGHEHYVLLDDSNQSLIPLAVDALIEGVLERIRSNKSQLPNNLAIMEEEFNTITLEKVSQLERQCVDLSEKAFDCIFR